MIEEVAEIYNFKLLKKKRIKAGSVAGPLIGTLFYIIGGFSLPFVIMGIGFLLASPFVKHAVPNLNYEQNLYIEESLELDSNFSPYKDDKSKGAYEEEAVSYKKLLLHPALLLGLF